MPSAACPIPATWGSKRLVWTLNDSGAIVVDDYFQTSVDNIYALGDIIDRYQLTSRRHWRGDEACVQPVQGYSRGKWITPISRRLCSPIRPFGTVGLTEEDARDRYGDVEIYRSTFRGLKDTLTGSSEQTLMKLIRRQGI